MTAVSAVLPPSWHGALFLALLLALSTHVVHPPPSSEPSAPPSPLSSPLKFTSAPSATSIDQILGAELLARITALSKFSESSFPASAGVNRPFLSESGSLARTALLAFFSDAGLSAHVDGAGNVIGRLSCPSAIPRRALALGSHFDSVRGGGVWDGSYGVLAAIAVAKAVARRKAGVCALPFDIAVFAFDDEEGNNDFGTTNFGAKSVAGVLDLPADVEPLMEQYKKVFPAVASEKDLRAAVADRVRSAAVDPDSLLGFIEMHIEQGPVLERLGASVGVVDAIAGQTRLSVTFSGASGHAGTVPMPGRRDALAAAAKTVSLVEEVGRKRVENSVVATVGMLSVLPGGSNVIPGKVTISVDIRAPRDEVREEAVRELLSGLNDIGREREMEVDVIKNHEVAAVRMSPWLQGVLEDVVSSPTAVPGCVRENCSASFEQGKETESVVLTSGAGHDTQFMARITDAAMMFVKCRGGVSHHVDEHVDEEDARQGAWALLKAVDAVAETVAGEA